ncbi:hypothetical protein [Sciscionella marina]|uniref:hypothetical protein n=1 Tax=Sciscionella marina TaxID=508770 RepID=UPI00036B1A03|nr:hypothetical protein [Sciscionella marina]
MANGGARAEERTWGTFGCERTILCVGRSLTSVIRLLETSELFSGDFRLRRLFTLQDEFRHRAHAERLLREARVDRIVPWSQAKDQPADLVLTASENIDPATVRGPIVVLPHGIGFNKFVPERDGNGTRIAGVPSAAALGSGRITLVLAHAEQEQQLRASCPEVLGHTVVTGDPTVQRLDASRALRARFRRLLGTGERRLVFLSSTWGRASALGLTPKLPHALLAALPADSYQVCAALHPNITSHYNRADVADYYAEALDAGLALLPPEAGWHAALVASDVVIADHGSLGLYAAGLGKPLLLTGSAEEIVPGTPVETLAGLARRLDPRGDLRAQIDAAPEHRTEGTRQVFAHRADAAERVRALLYSMLGLDPEPEARLARVPDPAPERRPVRAFRVRITETGETLVLERFPASVAAEEHYLVVDEADTDLRRAEKAAVLLTEDPEATLARYPGARLAAKRIPHGCQVFGRAGESAILSGADASVLAAIAYHLVCTGRFDSTDFPVRLGEHETTVRVRQVASGPPSQV